MLNYQFSKKRIVQIGAAALIIIVLISVSFIYYRKGYNPFESKADVVPNASGLTATLVGATEDVLYDHWAYQWIVGALDNGLINTCNADFFDPEYLGDALFHPDMEISKIEAVVMMARAKRMELAESYTQSFLDVSSSSTGKARTDDIFRYVEAAYRARLLEGFYQTGTDGTKTLDALATLSINDFSKLLVNFDLAATNTVQYPEEFPQVDRNTTNTNRAHAASLVVHNANLAGAGFEIQAPAGVYLEWNFPDDNDPVGYDWGYTIYRKDLAQTDPVIITAMDPPDVGTEEGAEMGMFLDDIVDRGHTYTYTIYFLNRAGEYSDEPATVTIETK